MHCRQIPFLPFRHFHGALVWKGDWNSPTTTLAFSSNPIDSPPTLIMLAIDNFVSQAKHILLTIYFYLNTLILDRLKKHHIILSARQILTESRLSHEDPVTQLVVLSFTILFVFTVTSIVWRAGKAVSRMAWFVTQVVVLGAGLWLAHQYRNELVQGARNIMQKLNA